MRASNAPILFRRRKLGLDLVEDAPAFALADAGDVVLILEQHADGVGDGFGVERKPVQFGQRTGPVDGLGDARHLEQVNLAQLLHERDHLGDRRLLAPGTLVRTISSSRAASG